MAFNTLSDIANAYEAGRHWSGYWRRGGPTMTAGLWTDLSYAAGIPVANYYAAAPYVSALLNANDGILHGPAVNAGGHKKYLHKAMIMPRANITTAVFYLHDIVMFYPFVDGDGGDQPLDNTVAIPRYGGHGCKIMLVSQGAGIANAQDTIITYTNSDGVQKTWQGFTGNANSAGQLISGPTNGTQPANRLMMHGNPYIIGQGDRGVRSIDNINMLSGVGGIFVACIIKPIATMSMQTSEDTPIEVDFARDRQRVPMHEIQDGAYLNLIGQSSATQTPATMHGEFSFVWT